MPSPIPKRGNEGHPYAAKRRNEKITKARSEDDVFIPPVDEEWHPIAKMLYKSAQTSGQSRFYQSSDWVVLYSFCEDLSNYKFHDKRSPTMLASLNSVMLNLCLTEGDRRKVHIELEKDLPTEDKSAGLTVMSEWLKKQQQAS